jgi:putative alpha-1,2-mannosidase
LGAGGRTLDIADDHVCARRRVRVGGYSYRDHLIHGFSLTHFSGAGCAGFGDIPIMPTVAAVSSSPAVRGSANVASRYLARFEHRYEYGSPGDYSVVRDPGTRDSIGVQLTATTRTGAVCNRAAARRSPRQVWLSVRR